MGLSSTVTKQRECSLMEESFWEFPQTTSVRGLILCRRMWLNVTWPARPGTTGNVKKPTLANSRLEFCGGIVASDFPEPPMAPEEVPCWLATSSFCHFRSLPCFILLLSDPPTTCRHHPPLSFVLIGSSLGTSLSPFSLLSVPSIFHDSDQGSPTPGSPP